MVSLVDAREDVYQTFEDAWGATSAFTFDDEGFDPPAGEPFVRLVMRHDGSTLECIGGRGDGGRNTYQRTGRVFIQVFTPTDQGTRIADTLTQAARVIFEGRTLPASGMRFNAVAVREIGVRDGWYQINLEAPFQYDERK